GRAPVPAPSVTVVRNGETRVRVHVSGADNPFWLVLGQSHSDGWKAHIVHGSSLGPSHVVDGYANGWLVRPNRAAFDVVVEWTPQRQVWAAIWLSVLAALTCVAIVGRALLRRRRRAATDVAGDADVRLEWQGAPRRSLGTRPSDRV